MLYGTGCAASRELRQGYTARLLTQLGNRRRRQPRGGRVRLQTLDEWRAALELQRHGRGYVRDGNYETWIDATPAPIQHMLYGHCPRTHYYL